MPNDYEGAPRDGSAWEHDGTDAWRVLRGGGWDNDPRWLRSADRNIFFQVVADVGLGFLLARIL